MPEHIVWLKGLVEMNGFHPDELNKFYKAVLSLKNEEECARFFEDVCTIKELKDMAQRLGVAIMLKDGKSYQNVSAEIGASTATISRVNRCLMYGNGGYNIVLERMNSSEKTE